MVSLHIGSPTNHERMEIFKFALFRSRKTSRIQIFVKGVNGFGASKWRVYCESLSTESAKIEGMASKCRKISCGTAEKCAPSRFIKEIGGYVESVQRKSGMSYEAWRKSIFFFAIQTLGILLVNETTT